MKRIQFGRWAMIVLAASTLSTGCALFGGGDEEEGAGEGSGFDAGPAMGDEGMGPVSVPELEAVYFDYDRSNIRSDQGPTLRSNSSAIASHDEWRTVVIEGHCDERGSEEYNLALGERRAASVKQYLSTVGVSASRMDTVSFGESKPAVQGHDESAWKWNRRAEFKVIKGR
jgi:peptidoglycan-associated lipoprotein